MEGYLIIVQKVQGGDKVSTNKEDFRNLSPGREYTVFDVEPDAAWTHTGATCGPGCTGCGDLFDHQSLTLEDQEGRFSSCDFMLQRTTISLNVLEALFGRFRRREEMGILSGSRSF